MFKSFLISLAGVAGGIYAVDKVYAVNLVRPRQLMQARISEMS